MENVLNFYCSTQGSWKINKNKVNTSFWNTLYVVTGSWVWQLTNVTHELCVVDLCGLNYLTSFDWPWDIILYTRGEHVESTDTLIRKYLFLLFFLFSLLSSFDIHTVHAHCYAYSINTDRYGNKKVYYSKKSEDIRE